MTMSRMGSSGRRSGISTGGASAGDCSAMITLSLQRQRLEVSREAGADFRVLQAEFHGRFEESKFVSGVVSFALDQIRIHGGRVCDSPQGVCQLNFLVFAGRRFLERRKNIRRQDVASDHREPGGRFIASRFFDQIRHPKQTGPDGFGCDDADRKSTRLNSSHRTISYAVFCLKKKKKY